MDKNKNRAKICLAQNDSKLAANTEKNLSLCISWSGADSNQKN